MINNIYNPAVYDAFPTVFNQLETFNPLINTTAIADWDVIAAIAASGAVHADSVQYVSQVAGDTDWSLTDDAVGAATVNAITSADYSAPNFMFSYFVGVDENGHMHGGASQQYADAITNVDENLAAIMGRSPRRASSGPSSWSPITDIRRRRASATASNPNETSTFRDREQSGSVLRATSTCSTASSTPRRRWSPHCSAGRRRRTRTGCR